MAGYHIYRSDVADRDRREMLVAPGESRRVEGRVHRTIYYANEDSRRPGGLQITRTYAEAAKAAGGKVIHEYEDGGVHHVIVSVPRNGTEAWFDVFAPTVDSYVVDMVEIDTTPTTTATPIRVTPTERNGIRPEARSAIDPTATVEPSSTTATTTAPATTAPTTTAPATTNTTPASSATPAASTPSVSSVRVIQVASDTAIRATDSVLIIHSSTSLRLQLPAASDGRTLIVKAHVASKPALIEEIDLGSYSLEAGHAVTLVYSTALHTWFIVGKV
ncbi:MAG: hypothetical protein IAE82_16495 [Opitutaceae bacterium]|nr:hypothetical protein [Opitutaceae bacterium]